MEEETEGPSGSYGLLAGHFGITPPGVTSLTLTFHEIEAILQKELPRSAWEYRAWWSNDPTKPQSAAWLDEGWRTTSVNMTDRRLTFVRTNDREQDYIRFFAKLSSQLEAVSDSLPHHLRGANAFEQNENKRLFDQLFERKSEFEKIVGEPMEWERMENRLACRIAIYTKAQISTDADNPALLDWATKRATYLFLAFGRSIMMRNAFAWVESVSRIEP